MGRMPSGERGDVGGLGCVDEITGREHARHRGPQGAVDARRACARIHHEAPLTRQLVIRDPLAGEHHRVARELARRPRDEVGHHHRFDPVPSADDLDPAANEQRHAAAPRRQPRERAVALVPGCSVTMATVAVPARASVSTAEKLTCSAPTTTARRPTA